MRAIFREWYPPTADEFSQLWNEGMIVLDASALLGLYRMAKPTAEMTLELYDWLGDRLWVPYQAAYEYHRNRIAVVKSQSSVYAKLETELSRFQSKLLQDVGQYGVLAAESFRAEVSTKMTELRNLLSELEAKHPWPRSDDPNGEDPIQDRLIQLLEGRIGAQLEVTEQLRQDAMDRMSARVPPGYIDFEHSDKSDPLVGDLLIWLEIIDRVPNCDAAKRGTLFVTEDQKEDWWRLDDKVPQQRLGPRTELAVEASRAGAAFLWMQTPIRFLESGAGHLGWEIENLISVQAVPS